MINIYLQILHLLANITFAYLGPQKWTQSNFREDWEAVLNLPAAANPISFADLLFHSFEEKKQLSMGGPDGIISGLILADFTFVNLTDQRQA